MFYIEILGALRFAELCEDLLSDPSEIWDLLGLGAKQCDLWGNHLPGFTLGSRVSSD